MITRHDADHSERFSHPSRLQRRESSRRDDTSSPDDSPPPIPLAPEVLSALRNRSGKQSLSSTRTSHDAARRRAPHSRRAIDNAGPNWLYRLAQLCGVAAMLWGGYLLLGRAPVASPRPARASAASATPTRTPRSTPIEQIRLGQRVAGTNPVRDEVDGGREEPNPQAWREVHLEMVKSDGRLLRIELLRTLNWIALSDADEGASIYLDLPELGAQGDAEVRSILPCPAIESGAGTIVTGRFIHEVASQGVVSLSLEGQAEPTGVTANHPYWSVDRQAFVPAGELEIGERIDTVFGVRNITAIAPRRGPPVTTVYNLETLEHVYRVGELGALVHNSYAKLSKSTGLVPSGMTALGEWGEARLAIELGGEGVKPGKAYVTSLGKRYVDRLVGRVAHEAKAGVNVALTPGLRKQALKDAELIARDRIDAAHWHFFQGAQQETLDFLKGLGIRFTVY